MYSFVRFCSHVYAPLRNRTVHKLHTPMATVTKLRSGSWRALVRRKGNYASRTFRLKSDAEAWSRDVEGRIDRGENISARATGLNETFRDLIQLHIADMCEVGKAPQRSKAYTLSKLERDLGAVSLRNLTRERLVTYAKSRARDGAGPATVGMEFSYIKTIVLHAAAVHGLAISADAVDQARIALKRLELIGKPVERDRRPKVQEIEALVLYFEDKLRQKIPVGRLLQFAIATAMRQDEICRLAWNDFDEQNRVIKVRQRKDPRKKHQNDQLVPLVDVAGYDPIALMLEELNDRDRVGLIFPYNGRSLGTAFRRACHTLGIEDLHFHDLRHEATSRLFEAGLDIPEVARITGHKDWKQLRRYTHLKADRVAGRADAIGKKLHSGCR